MKTIITILDSIQETSMPFNEFVLYRANHIKDEVQHLIICDEPKSLPVFGMDNLKIEYIGGNILKWRSRLLSILARYNRNDYAIHLHQAGPSMKILLLMIGSGFNKKVVFTVHSTFSGYKFHNKVRSFIDGALSRYVVCCSETSYEKYPKLLKASKGARILYIRNGVDTYRIDSLIGSHTNSKHSSVIFVYVARMIPLKNHDFLLDVAKECSPNVKFLLIGKESKSIIKRIKDENLENKIMVTGLITRNEVFEKLQEADVYISTSTLEGLPVSVLEGMYTGKPAILSNIRQHIEVSDNCDFVTILPFDKNLWVDTINKYARMSIEYLNDLGRKSRKYVSERFSLDIMHYSYTQIYKQLMEI